MNVEKIQVVVASQVNIVVQPVDADACDAPAQIMKECQWLADARNKPVVFLDKHEQRYQFNPRKIMSEQRREELDALIGNMSLSEIATNIKRDWKKPYFGAIPYLDALRSMNDIKDNFGADSGRSIVAYFLSNATTWRGPVARIVKAELNRRLKAK